MSARSAESRRKQRETEKALRQKKCVLSEEHYKKLREMLQAVVDGRPDFAAIAKKLKETYQLDCEIAWLRPHIASKWEEWSGKGAERRKKLRERAMSQSSTSVFWGVLEGCHPSSLPLGGS